MVALADETEFTLVRRGYDRAHVEEQIGTLIAQVRAAVTAREVVGWGGAVER